ncbi:MAG TPA: hypothetical protein VD866_32795, partial [Urbifossiella sp.]|nr:hypothetical protein [Urbifossiella sp.]
EFRNLDSGLYGRSLTVRAATKAGENWTRFSLSPDGKRVAVRDTAERVTVYDAATGAVLGSSGEPSAGVTFVPGREWVLSSEYIRHPLSPGHGLRARTPPGFAVVADLPAAGLEPAVSDDGRVLVTGLNGMASPEFAVWDLTAIP